MSTINISATNEFHKAQDGKLFMIVTHIGEDKTVLSGLNGVAHEVAGSIEHATLGGYVYFEANGDLIPPGAPKAPARAGADKAGSIHSKVNSKEA